MSFKKVTFLFLLAFLMQLSVVNFIEIKSTGPNLVMCMMIIITFLYEDGYRSIPFAIFFGLILDICCGAYVGPCALSMFAVGIFVAACHVWLNVEKIQTLIVSGIIATVIYEVAYYIILKALGNPMGVEYAAKILPAYVIYNLVVLIFMFLMMHKKAEQYHNDRYSNDEY